MLMPVDAARRRSSSIFDTVRQQLDHAWPDRRLRGVASHSGNGGVGPLLLFVDDEPDNLRLTTLHFGTEYELVTAESADHALRILETREVGVLFTDERMPGRSGIDLLEIVSQRWPDVVRVIVSAYSDAPRLLGAINRGHAHEYVLKPWSAGTLRECIERCRGRAEQRRQLALRAELGEVMTRTPLSSADQDEPVVGWSTGLSAVADLARRAAAVEAPVLLLGETGTGKELVARAIHDRSRRAGGPLVPVNCGALSDGLLESELFGHEAGAFTGALRARKGRFELASGGTLFLDEVGDVSPRMQVALLRALQDGRIERVGGQTSFSVDTRVIAATNRDLLSMVRQGTFREDLFYRLAVLHIQVPPLRERVADIPALVACFIAKNAQSTGRARPHVGKEVLDFLQAYHWPGNVRELENMVQRALILCDGDELGLDDFTFLCPRPSEGDLRDQVQQREAATLREVLLTHGGNATRAARALNIPRTTLLSRARKLGLL
jgi:two-component system response regulator HupR/HoxA